MAESTTKSPVLMVQTSCALIKQADLYTNKHDDLYEWQVTALSKRR